MLIIRLTGGWKERYNTGTKTTTGVIDNIVAINTFKHSLLNKVEKRREVRTRTHNPTVFSTIITLQDKLVDHQEQKN